tara:strand:- start:1344 stop:2159 length:816 start_codon:yes stop_codon:yes gene_type:complete
MIKSFKYLSCFIILVGCLQLNKPFQNTKITPPISNSLNSVIYIDNIIGVSNKIDLELKKRISNKLLKKDILASYKYFNKNSFIVKTTLVKYNKKNITKIIFNIVNPSHNNNRLEIILTNNKINSNDVQDAISSKLSEFIERKVLKLNKNKFVKIIEIKGFEDSKKLENIFYKNLVNIYSLNSIQIINQKKIINDKIKNYSSIRVNFNFNDIGQERVKVIIIWEILDNNENLIGTIKQENIIKKSIINYVWEEISNKIIEMSLSELNMIINL